MVVYIIQYVPLFTTTYIITYNTLSHVFSTEEKAEEYITKIIEANKDNTPFNYSIGQTFTISSSNGPVYHRKNFLIKKITVDEYPPPIKETYMMYNY